MWEQGVQATGYVRAGPKDEPPEFVAATWLHPVERARQSVRDAILERLAGDQDGSDPARTRVAGVVADVRNVRHRQRRRKIRQRGRKTHDDVHSRPTLVFHG